VILPARSGNTPAQRVPSAFGELEAPGDRLPENQNPFENHMKHFSYK
jgi:hypothetical protein